MAEQEGILLKGQPDEIYELKNGDFIVIDYHISLKGNEAPDYYKYQLGIYFILIEETYQRRPAYGLLENKRSGQYYIIDNTDDLRKEVLNTIKEMKSIIQKEKQEDIHRNHEDPHRCTICPYKSDCTEALL